MNSSLTMLKRAVPLACAALCVAGAAQAALQDRDLTGDSVIDAFYDTDLDITWLKYANLIGPLDWDSAVTWADGFNFAGYDDWRLPRTIETCENTYNCPGSEMFHLWNVELGIPVFGPMTNTGGFLDLGGGYWHGTQLTSNPAFAFAFISSVGYTGINYKEVEYRSMLVRDGDVPSIPEPETYALMLAGLAGLALAKRRRLR